MRAAGAACFLIGQLLGVPGQAQVPHPAGEGPPLRDRVPLIRIDTRTGFLITSGEGFTDRPFLQVDGGIQLGRAHPGGPPALGITLGAAIEAGEFLAESSSLSMRILGGIELPVALALSSRADRPVELVPAIQAGYQESFGEDDRTGFTARAALGLRLFPAGERFYLTFEPVSLALLPLPEAANRRNASRFAVELGLLKIGWRF